ncbi:MAG: sulfatase family protein, partial [Gaiellaceae bacterium]
GLDGAHPTLAEAFAARGYLTAGFVANTFYAGWESGLQRGFAHYEEARPEPRDVLGSLTLLRGLAKQEDVRRLLGNRPLLGRKLAPEVNRDFLRWLSAGSREGRPFFVFLNYFDAHAPYAPPPPFDERFGVPPPDRRPGMFLPEGRSWTEREIGVERTAYEASIVYLDHYLGRLFDELARRGLLRRTLVLVTSDHGEEFGEHGLMNHGNSLYWPSLHVPLLIAFPGRVPAGRRIAEPVTLRDVAATLYDLALPGAAAPSLPGESLARHWRDPRAPSGGAASPLLSEVRWAPNLPEWYPVSKGDLRSLVAGRHHYVRNADGSEELYDVFADPWEQRDLTRQPAGRDLAARLRAALEAARGLGTSSRQRDK